MAWESALNLPPGAANLAPMSGDSSGNAADRFDGWFTTRRFALWLGLALAVAFAPVLGDARSFYFFDYGVLGYPFAFFHRVQFWSGNFFPLWNPLSNCGAPFLAQWGTMTLYPGSLIYLLLPMPWSLGLFCVLHLFLAGLGMQQLALAWWKSPFAAAVAGTAFAFSGIILASVIWPNYCVALGWMPWVVLLAERTWREGGAGRIALAALAGAMQMLSGVPELVLFTWLVIGAFAIAGVARRECEASKTVLRLAFVAVLVAGLSLSQLLPFFELLGTSQRHAGFASSKWAMPLWGVGNLLVPLFHNFTTFQGAYVQEDQTFLPSCYPGVIVVLLACLAFVRARTWRVWLLGGLLAASIVLAWGESGLVFGWLRSVIPLVGVARYPVKFLFLAAFVFPLLAAAAVATFSNEDARRFGKTTAFVALGLLVAIGLIVWLGFAHAFPYDKPAVAGWNAAWRAGFLLAGAGLLWAWATNTCSRVKCFGIAVVVLIAVDAYFHKPGLNPTLSADVFRPGKAEFRPPELGTGRVMISPAAERALLRSEIPDPTTDFLGKRLALWSNLNLLEHAPKVNGSSTLQLRWQKDVQDLIYGTNAVNSPGLVDFLGVNFATASNKVVEWASRTGAMPMVTIGQKPSFEDGTDALSAWRGTSFNPRDEVILPQEAQFQVKATRNAYARIVRQSFGMQRVEVEIDTAQPAIAVIAQSYHTPWQATVDGYFTPVWRANHAFQAVEIPAGGRQLVLTYEDNAFRAGAGVSGASLLLCGLMIFRERRLRGGNPAVSTSTPRDS